MHYRVPIFLCFIALSLNLLAFAGGDGSKDDPYQVSTLAELQDVANHPDLCFIQICDIDAGETQAWNDSLGFLPIGDELTPFTGTYDGQYFSVGGLFINRTSSDENGLFGTIVEGEVLNLYVLNCDITGVYRTAAVAAHCTDATVANCYSTGTISTRNGGGGIVGRIVGTLIEGCATAVDVSSYSSGIYCGGLVGGAIDSCMIVNSYALGSVRCDNRCGGLVGTLEDSTVEYCYSTASVSATESVGGLVGELSGTATVVGSFWNRETSGQSTSAGGVGKTTVFMKDPMTFFNAGWDFVAESGNGTDDTWNIDIYGSCNDNYPFLSWQDGDVRPVELPSGSGTEADPYRIETLDHLAWLSASPSVWGGHFLQTADINASDTHNWNGGSGFSPIGDNANPFTGNYNGQNNSIEGLYIYSTDGFIGFFGSTNSATLSNIVLIDCNVRGNDGTGGLVGDSDYDTITNCGVTGSVRGDYATGGLIGRLTVGTVKRCYSKASISCVNEGDRTGGLVGYATNNVTIANCYARGSVSGDNKVGGLVGDITASEITNCYSTGEVTSVNSELGGLVGFTGDEVTVTGSFWNTATSGLDTSLGGTGLTTGEMTYFYGMYHTTGWDFVAETAQGSANIWDKGSSVNNGYPYLAWEDGSESSLQAPSGSGTSSDPYLIANLFDLFWISVNSNKWDKRYLQTADIDAGDTQNWFGGSGFKPISKGYTDSFSGVYDGDEHVIDGLYVRASDIDGGLFRYSQNATFKNMTLTNADIEVNDDGGVLTGESHDSSYMNCHSSGNVSAFYAGGLIGYASSCTITNCSSSASVIGTEDVGGLVGLSSASIQSSSATGSVDGEENVGGLVGRQTSSTINKSFATGNVEGDDNIGGLVGHFDGTSIGQSFATGNVTGGSDAGGLVGFLESGNVYDCYSTGDTDGDWAGGLVSDHRGSFYRCYSTGYVCGSNDEGGLVGYLDNGHSYDSFWDVETSGQSTSHGGVGKTTTEMKNLLIYLLSGWDFPGETVNGFDDIWVLDSSMNDGYPTLAWQGGTSESFAAPEGDGTEGNPYLIDSLEDLSWIMLNTSAWGRHFLQTADIDAGETQSWVGDKGFIPIGKEGEAFFGSYNGQGFTISGLYINRSDSENIGLWGYTDGAEITDVNLTNVVICGSVHVGALIGTAAYSTVVSGCASSGNVTGVEDIGGLVGLTFSCSITNCHTDGSVLCNHENGWRAGGLVGSHSHGGNMADCYSEAEVSGANMVGGLIGKSYNAGQTTGTVTQCYSVGDVNGTGSYVGGLFGYVDDYTHLTDSYSIGNATGNSNVGGLAGSCSSSATVMNCYSVGSVTGDTHVGGLLGSNNSSCVSASFWDMETSGRSTSAGGTGKTTAEMKTIYTYTSAGWDFLGEFLNGTEDFWFILSNEYPQLNNGTRMPVITGVNDVPGDQGHQVDLVWNKAPLDVSYSPNRFYSVWRLVEDTRALGSAIVIEDPEQFVAPEGSRALMLHQRDSYWTWLATIPAVMHNQYSFISPTLVDSSASLSPEEYQSTYMVYYHFETGYLASNESSGYSIDNIAPYAATGVTLAFNATRNTSARKSSGRACTGLATLSWNEVNEGGYNGNSYPEQNGVWYRVHAADTPDFACDETTLLGTTQDTSYEITAMDSVKKFYRVVVSDQP